MKRILMALFLALPALVAAAPQLPKLDAYLKNLEQEGTFYGSVLVTRGQANLFRGDYGFQDEAKTLKNHPATQYGLAELGESMVASLVLMAQDKGLLSLQEPLGTYLPAFKGKPAPRVRDLLCHATGLPVYRLDPYGSAKPGTLTLDALAAGLAESPLLAEPGTRYEWQYRDYDLAGLVLEKVTGMPYPTLVAEWIAKPLGLEHTGAGFASASKDLAWTMRLAKYQQELELWKGAYRPSMAHRSTLDEIARFFQTLLSGRLVKPDSLKIMQTPLVQTKIGDGVGLGFYQEPSGLFSSYSTEGSGYTTLYAYDPRYELSILILTNRWMGVEGKNLRRSVMPAVYAALELKE